MRAVKLSSLITLIIFLVFVIFLILDISLRMYYEMKTGQFGPTVLPLSDQNSHYRIDKKDEIYYLTYSRVEEERVSYQYPVGKSKVELADYFNKWVKIKGNFPNLDGEQCILEKCYKIPDYFGSQAIDIDEVKEIND